MEGITFYKAGLECNKEYKGFFDNKAGYQLPRSFFEDINMPMQKFLHTTFKSHIFPFAALVAKEYGISGTELLAVIKDEVSDILNAAKKEHMPHVSDDQKDNFLARIETIRDGLLNKPVLDKAMLLMFITGSYDKINVSRGAMNSSLIINGH
jgi:hypothetical protein